MKPRSASEGGENGSTDTGSEFEGSPLRNNKGKNSSTSSSRGSEEGGGGGGTGAAAGQGKALKWMRGTFCKFAKA